MRSNIKRVKERFPGDVAEHEMTIMLNDGVYRHIRFKKPGTMMYYFDLTTWPGFLAITGDMGSYVFSRLRDMFEFFGIRTGYGIDYRYWAEKCQASDRNSGMTDWDEEAYVEWIDRMVEDALDYHPNGVSSRGLGDFNEQIEILRDAKHYKEEAERAVMDFYESGWIDESPLEHFEQPSYHLAWCMHAIQWGIQQYNEKEAQHGGQDAAT